MGGIKRKKIQTQKKEEIRAMKERWKSGLVDRPNSNDSAAGGLLPPADSCFDLTARVHLLCSGCQQQQYEPNYAAYD